MHQQRRLGLRSRKKNYTGPVVIYDKSLKLDEYLDDKTRLNAMKNRSCYFRPDMKDVGQLTEFSDSTGKERRKQNYDPHRHSIDINDSILYKTLQNGSRESTYFSQGCSEEPEKSQRVSSPLNNVCNSEIRSYVKHGEMVNEDNYTNQNISLKDVRISNEPRIKTIAEKFSRYKRNDVEIRKLEGRVVCVEYDVFSKETETNSNPVQVLRAYFTVTPVTSTNTEKGKIDDDVKNKDMGIEIIEAKIPQNKVYLEDLKRFLKRKQNNKERYDQSPLNPIYLYKIARKDVLNDFSYTDLLSKTELDEIKDLIMKKTASSVYGINRRKLRPEEYSKNDTGEDIIIDQILKFM